MPVLFLAFLFARCGNEAGTKQKTVHNEDRNTIMLTDAQFNNAGISTTQLSSGNIAATLKLNGKIDVPPQNLISVSVPLGGYLKSTRLLPGMPVRKGEVIAVMEDQRYIQLQQDYLLAKSRYHLADLDYTRQKDLNQSQAASDKVMQQAQTEMDNQRTIMNALGEQLRLINISPGTLSAGKISGSVPLYSSINGYVSRVNVNTGKYVNPPDVLFELIDPSDIHLNLKVYEKDIARVSIGQRVAAYTNTDPGKRYDCAIILISKDISPEGITEVHCHFEHYYPSLLPGTYMNAELEIHPVAAALLPQESVVNFEGKSYVFVQTGRQTYRMVAVVAGTEKNGFIAIQNAKELTGKTIVANGAYTLLMKMKNTVE